MTFSLRQLTSGMFSRVLLNSNFEKIENKVNDDLVHRQNGSAQMQQDLDMNGNNILNLGDPTASLGVATKDYVDTQDNVLLSAIQNIEASGTIRQTSEEFTATQGQTVFTLTTTTFAGEDTLAVYVNGVRQSHSAYTTSSTNVITFSEALQDGDKVLFTVNESTSTTLTATQISGLTVDTIADLLNVSPSTSTVVNVLNYHSGVEGGGGVFYWDANRDGGEHNGGTIIASTAQFPPDWLVGNQQLWFAPMTGTGCWVRQYSGAVDVKWFGAKGDGVADDTAAIQAALTYVQTNNLCLYIPSGTYVFTSTLNFDSAGWAIKGEETASTVLKFNGDGVAISDLGYNTSFEKFTLDAGTGAHTIGWNSDRTDTTGNQSIRVQEVTINGFSNDWGLYITNGWKMTFDRVRVSGCSNGIYMGEASGPVNDVTLNSCDLARIANTCLRLGRGASNRVYGGNYSGDSVTANSVGILCTDSNDACVIDGPYIENKDVGIQIEGSRNLNINGVFVNGTGPSTGVKVLGAKRGSISEVFAKNCAYAVILGDGAGAEPEWTNISGLYCFGGTDYLDQTINGTMGTLVTAGGTVSQKGLTILSTITSSELGAAKNMLTLDVAESGGPNLTGGEGSAVLLKIPGNTDASYAGGRVSTSRTASDSLNLTDIVFENNQNEDLSETLTEVLRLGFTGNIVKSGGPLWASGTGSPEGVVTAPIGSFYSRTDGGAGTSFYIKESGTGNTGWVAK
jgi:hypothetical protein